MFRSLKSRTLLLVALVAAAGAIDVAAQSDAPIFPVDPTSGISVEILASAEATWEPLGGVSLRLERVTPESAASPLVSNGPELWFAETEPLDVTPGSGPATSLGPGESTLVSGVDGVTAGFGSAACATALRLVAAPVFAMIAGSEAEGPSLPPSAGEDCPAPATLMDGVDLLPPAMPATLVIARFTLEPSAYLDPVSFGGPIGLAVESGTVSIVGQTGVQVSLDAGSWVAAQGDASIGLFEMQMTPASMLVAAILPGEPLATGAQPGGSAVAAPDYTSALFGYTLSWDDTWTVSEDISSETGERLLLNNGVSDLYIESFPDYGENALNCVVGVRTSLDANPAYSNVQSMESPSVEPASGGDETSAFATFTFLYEGDTFSGEYAEYLECRVIVPGEAVLLITHFAPLESYALEQEAVQRVLETLRFPE